MATKCVPLPCSQECATDMIVAYNPECESCTLPVKWWLHPDNFRVFQVEEFDFPLRREFDPPIRQRRN